MVLKPTHEDTPSALDITLMFQALQVQQQQICQQNELMHATPAS